MLNLVTHEFFVTDIHRKIPDLQGESIVLQSAGTDLWVYDLPLRNFVSSPAKAMKLLCSDQFKFFLRIKIEFTYNLPDVFSREMVFSSSTPLKYLSSALFKI